MVIMNIIIQGKRQREITLPALLTLLEKNGYVRGQTLGAGEGLQGPGAGTGLDQSQGRRNRHMGEEPGMKV